MRQAIFKNRSRHRFAHAGKIKGPILRGLSARAPYFHNASLDEKGSTVSISEWEKTE
jgi:cytochrome c peroxidase